MKAIKNVSFKEAELSDNEYWKSKSPEDKLDTLQYLREIFFIIEECVFLYILHLSFRGNSHGRNHDG